MILHDAISAGDAMRLDRLSGADRRPLAQKVRIACRTVSHASTTKIALSITPLMELLGQFNSSHFEIIR